MTEERKSVWVEWLKCALVRAVKTWAQVGVAYLGSGAIGIFDVDWIAFLSVTCMAFVASLLTSLAGIPEVNDGVSMLAIKEDAGADGGDI